MQLKVSGLRCRYPHASADAVDVESLVLTPGSTALAGINGAGKTTLLLTMAGSRRPRAGTVTLEGVDLFGRRRRDVLSQIGYMPQVLNMPSDVRVGDAMAYASWVRGVPAITAAPRNASLLEMVALDDRVKDRVGRLSGGMQRRLTLAMALVTGPSVLLLDEPTTGLDPEQRIALRDLVSTVSGDAIVLMSSHVMEDVERMTSSIIVLADGRVRYHGANERFMAEHGGPERSSELAFLSVIARARTR